MSNLPDLKVRIGADGSGVGPGVAQAKRGLSGLDASMKSIGALAAKSFALVTTGVASFKAAALAAGVAAGKMAVEIQNSARLANADTTTFQKWAAAAKSVGVEQDKLADILKDVSDRVGEFLSTGSGPMADFFENIAPRVGVTADQFARLSGPEALQLYVDSLQKAGVNQQQMTFYLEAMSGDLTSLLPLLQNGGSEIRRLGDAAEASGRILSEDMIRGGVEVDRLFDQISETLRTSATAAVLEHKDELVRLATFISETAIPAFADLLSEAGRIAEGLEPYIQKWAEYGKAVAFALGASEGGIATEGNATEKQNQAETNAWGRSQDDTSTTGTWPLDEDGNIVLDDGGPVLVTKNPAPSASGSYVPPAEKKGASKSGGPDRDQRQLERLQDQYASERDALEMHLQDQLDMLDEFREKKLASEEELADLEEKIRTDHAERMREIDEAALQQRLASWSSAFGDLSALMNSENKKLFAVGKAAAIAQAVVDGWSSAVSAWDKGMKVGGPPVAAAFTAMSLARTGAMIASLQSASSSGSGGSGGSSASSSAASTAATVSPTQIANYRITGDVIGRQTGEELVSSINAAIKDGYQINLEWA